MNRNDVEKFKYILQGKKKFQLSIKSTPGQLYIIKYGARPSDVGNWILGFWTPKSGIGFPVWFSKREILFREDDDDERRLNKKIKTLIIINCFFFLSLRILNNIYLFFCFCCVFIVFNAVLAFVSFCFMCAHFLSFGPFFFHRGPFGHNVAVSLLLFLASSFLLCAI